MPSLVQSYKLFSGGVNALSRATMNGFKVDLDYFKGLQPVIMEKSKRLSEEIIEATEIGRLWHGRFGDRINLSSPQQFKTVLELDFGFKDFKISEKGNASADADVISKLPAEFATRYISYKQMEKAYGTYVMPIIREADSKGFIHADFPLNRVKTYRGSGSAPNLQNQPKRVKPLMKMIRKGFIPRTPDRMLMELDLKGAECAIGACIHKDPAMIAYVTDDSLDMHRDGAMKVFILELGEMTKLIRNACKGDFTFAEFYGATYKTVAPALWESVLDPELKTKQGVPIQKHLHDHGIKDLDSFTAHIKAVEKHFWGRMFRGYAEWKGKIWQEYLDNGYIKTVTGFYLTQESTKEQILNAPIQGPSFHFLLNVLTRMTVKMSQRKMKSLILAQIHDAIVFDAVPEEVQMICDLYWECHDEVVKEWNWIIVPIRAEYEVSDVGGCWAEMSDCGYVKKGENK